MFFTLMTQETATWSDDENDATHDFPVRCFTCNKVISHRERHYNRRVRHGEHPYTVLDNMGIVRSCCRRMFMTHVSTMKDFSEK